MKNFLKSTLVICLIIIVNSCSKEGDAPDEDSPIRNSEVINYLNTPNTDGLLLSEVFIEEDKATTYFYGRTDSNGERLLTQSLAYNVDNSNKIDYIVLDELQRVKYIYSEVNGVKEKEIISFTYPQEGLVNCLVISRDWNTLEDSILDFSTVETSGDDFIAHNLFGKIGNTKLGDEQDVVRTWLLIGAAIIAVVVATNAGRVLIAAGTLTAKQVAIRGAIAAASGAILASDSANGAEPDYQTPNPNAPTAPETNVIENQCTSSNLSVIIGVDPGNVLVAIVNGDSATYDFYWSTGETATTPITHVITAPDDGVYYVMVRDEKGCIAFASASANANSVPNSGYWLIWDTSSNCVSRLPLYVIFNQDNTFTLVTSNRALSSRDERSTTSYSFAGNQFTSSIFVDSPPTRDDTQNWEFTGTYDYNYGNEIITGTFVHTDTYVIPTYCQGTFQMTPF